MTHSHNRVSDLARQVAELVGVDFDKVKEIRIKGNGDVLVEQLRDLREKPRKAENLYFESDWDS